MLGYPMVGESNGMFQTRSAMKRCEATSQVCIDAAVPTKSAPTGGGRCGQWKGWRVGGRGGGVLVGWLG